jgi:TRAP-type C4-dicarboxylate transport system permease small subunit
MILSISIDATARYLFNSPVAGVFELNEVMLVVCVFMGLTWTQMDRGNIRVEIFLLKLSPRWRHILDAFSWIVTLCFVSILFYMSYKGFLDSYRIREFRWGSVQMPIWWAKGLVPFGLLLLMLQLLLDIFFELKAFFDIKKPQP